VPDQEEMPRVAPGRPPRLVRPAAAELSAYLRASGVETELADALSLLFETVEHQAPGRDRGTDQSAASLRSDHSTWSPMSLWLRAAAGLARLAHAEGGLRRCAWQLSSIAALILAVVVLLYA